MFFYLKSIEKDIDRMDNKRIKNSFKIITYRSGFM